MIRKTISESNVRWRDAASCLEVDYDTFFPEGKSLEARRRELLAKQICRTCPVIAECLSWALETGQDHGIWGGLNEIERRTLKRRRKSGSQLMGEAALRA